MDYKHALEPKYHFDTHQEEINERALILAGAAQALNDILLWIHGREKSRANWRNARLVTIGVILGQMSIEDAAKNAGVTRQCIMANKKEFETKFGCKKHFHEPVRESE
jgi:hypothetical protein